MRLRHKNQAITQEMVETVNVDVVRSYEPTATSDIKSFAVWETEIEAAGNVIVGVSLYKRADYVSKTWWVSMQEDGRSFKRNKHKFFPSF